MPMRGSRPHYLMNHRLEALAAYEKALGAGASPASAWTAAFGSQTPEQLAVAGAPVPRRRTI
jgi:hypothetical protein